MKALLDTIVAPITAVGGAVALLRLSGSLAHEIALAVSDKSDEPHVPGARPSTRHVHYVTGDDGLRTLFHDRHSYTGERTAELSCHGSRASVQALIEACLSHGARMAEPGEFTYRAFMNGRVDLSQAEGVRDTVAAVTEAQLRQANRLRDGELRDRLKVVRDKALRVVAAIEASTDFSEEVGEVDRPACLDSLSSCLTDLTSLLSRADSGWVVHDGLTVAILGRPNAGKSSLLNAVLGSERAIVTEVPGTTRDTVEEVCDVNGVPVRFVDTAGLRDTDDRIEGIGVSRAKQSAASADHVWYVFDAATGWSPEDESATQALTRPVTVVANKCDLPHAATAPSAVGVSAKTGEGVKALLDSLAERLDLEHLPLPNRRHAPILAAAKVALEEAWSALSSNVPDDLAVVHVRAVIRCLGEVTGETASADVLERVFADFCIGK